MNYKTRAAATAALLALALTTTVAHADWNPGDDYKMHFPQLPDPNGFDVELSATLADDWLCTETGPITDIHFWFSAKGDWLDLSQPLDQQIFGLSITIYEDVPALPGGPNSKPGAQVWFRAFPRPFNQVSFRQYGTGSQSWFRPQDSLLIPNDHQKIYQCNISGIVDPFYQKKGTIYWMKITIVSHDQLGWKTSNAAVYPSPYTGQHYQDVAVQRAGDLKLPLFYPAGPNAGQGMDFAFVINGAPDVFNHKMHFPQYPDPTGADVTFAFPKVAADDWRCTQSGPVKDIHFWFSAIGDWLDLSQPLGQQIFNIHLSIHDDVPANAANPYSHPGNLLWQRDMPAMLASFSRYETEGQAWYDPTQGYVPKNHVAMYRCDIDSIMQPFIQEEGHIYWLDISIHAQEPLGWKTADVDAYPAPYTGNHFQDDGVWAFDVTAPQPPPLPWQELTWPIGSPNVGQSIDLAFVITDGEPTAVGDRGPETFYLEQNFPNPFNPATTIRYSLPVRAIVDLAVFGVDGRLVRVLESGTKPEGRFEAIWDGRDASGRPVASGVYFYRLQAGSFSEVKKMVLLK